MTKQAVCVTCIVEGVTTVRPAPHPGPRCHTHHWQVSRARRKHAVEQNRVRNHGGMTQSQYESLKAFQGGYCPICRMAKGVTKALAVDHNHKCAEGHPKEKSCPKCWRGLLCGPCNQMIGRAYDNPLFFDNAAAYLRNPPAQEWLTQPEKAADL